MSLSKEQRDELAQRYITSGSQFYDLDNRELSAETRRDMLQELAVEFKQSVKKVAQTVGERCAHEYKSFDESLNSYFLIYVVVERNKRKREDFYTKQKRIKKKKGWRDVHVDTVSQKESTT
jgi:hypothetical protein